MKIINVYKNYQVWIWPAILGILLLAGSLAINAYAGNYAEKMMSAPVTDLILDNTPVYQVAGLYSYGYLVLIILILGLALLKPSRIAFISKSIALFVLIRAGFICLTHLGAPLTHLIIIPPKLFLPFSYYGDLFFSGHAGLPFLMALIFWGDKYLRVLFIAFSLILSCVVLMGHLHYSIDVLGACFITYTIYHLALKFFSRDKLLFDQN